MSSWPDQTLQEAGTSSHRGSTVQSDFCHVVQEQQHSSLDSLRQEPASQALPRPAFESQVQPRDTVASAPACVPCAAKTPGSGACQQSPSPASSQSLQVEPRATDPSLLRHENRRSQPDQLSPFPSSQSNASGPTKAAICKKPKPGPGCPADVKEELGEEEDIFLPEESCGAGVLSSDFVSGHESPATVEELRVKNRSAQKRYRERQKGLKQQQAAERKRQKNAIEQLSQSNAVLTSRNKHLEHSLQLAISELAIRPAASPGQLLQQDLVRRNDRGLLEPVILEEGKAALLNISGPYVLHREQLSNLPLKQYMALIKGLVSTMHRSLVSSMASPGPEGSQRVEAAVSQFLFVGHNAFASNMVVARELHSLNMDSVTPLKPIPMDKWSGVLEMLKLSHDQKRQLVAARNQYLRTLGPLLGQQQALLGKIEGPLRDWTVQCSPARLGEVLATNIELTKAIKREHEAYTLLTAAVYCQVFTPMQVAMMAVRTWPVVPDLISLGGLAESQLQVNRLQLEDMPPSGLSSSTLEWTHHLGELTSSSGLSQHPRELNQRACEAIRQMRPMQGVSALSPSLAVTTLHHPANPANPTKLSADWHGTASMEVQQHQAADSGVQSQEAPPSSNRVTAAAFPLQRTHVSQPFSKEIQTSEALPDRKPQPGKRREMNPDNILAGVLSRQMNNNSRMGPDTVYPACQSRPRLGGIASETASASIQDNERRFQTPSAVAGGSIGADFPMDLLALPDQPAVPGDGTSQAFLSTARGHSQRLQPSHATPFDVYSSARPPSLHPARLCGMKQQLLGSHDICTGQFPANLLSLPDVSMPPLRHSMGGQGPTEGRMYADPSGVHSLADLCLSPRNSSSARPSADDDMWVPELPALPHEHRQQVPDEVMDLADLL
ncbi:hypothetical protein WJX74_003881 [Apatococcus lobatus]|uniref:BZIP domain-containing protein n=1 Tax=Apatococcus lobatus TaxID=904363 RepID=A0AAW1QJP0_9CHLO